MKARSNQRAKRPTQRGKERRFPIRLNMLVRDGAIVGGTWVWSLAAGVDCAFVNVARYGSAMIPPRGETMGQHGTSAFWSHG